MREEINKGLLVAVVIMTILIGVVFITKTKDVDPDSSIQEPPPIQEPVQKPVEPPKKEVSHDAAVASITKDELKESLYYLASDELEGRMTGQPGNKKLPNTL